MRIRGIGDRTPAQLAAELDAGGRLVFFECCISLLFLTLRYPSDVYFVPADESALFRGLPYSLVSFLLGWWGIPMGIIYTPLTLLTNFSGGCDVTNEVRPFLIGGLPEGHKE